MPRKTNLLNVRDNLKHVLRTCEEMLNRDGKHWNGLRLAPIDRDNLNQICFLTKAILRKNEQANIATKQRKDVYINV